MYRELCACGRVCHGWVLGRAWREAQAPASTCAGTSSYALAAAKEAASAARAAPEPVTARGRLEAVSRSPALAAPRGCVPSLARLCSLLALSKLGMACGRGGGVTVGCWGEPGVRHRHPRAHARVPPAPSLPRPKEPRARRVRLPSLSRREGGWRPLPGARHLQPQGPLSPRWHGSACFEQAVHAWHVGGKATRIAMGLS